MPAFAGGLLSVRLCLAGWRHRGHGRWAETGLAVLAHGVLVGWQVWQFRRMAHIYGPPQPRSWEEARWALVAHLQTQPVFLPEDGGYPSPAAPRQTGIPLNGAGWSAERDARLMPCVILFVDDPRFLALELQENPESTIPADPWRLRAKVGLEALRLNRVERLDNGWRVVFFVPTRPVTKRACTRSFWPRSRGSLWPSGNICPDAWSVCGSGKLAWMAPSKA